MALDLISHVRNASEEFSHLPILVTGGTGFVGGHLVNALANAGRQVRCLGRNHYATSRILHPNVALIRGDIRNLESVLIASRGCGLVFHTAALSREWARWEQFAQSNIIGTRNVLAACQQNSTMRLVHVSSTAVFFRYKDIIDQPDDELPVRPLPEYARSKWEAENLVLQACSLGLNAVVVRIRGVFGPGDNSILPNFLRAVELGKFRQIGSGENYTDLTYIDNVVYALALAAQRGRDGHAYTITNDEPVRLWPTLRSIMKAVPGARERRPVPRGLAMCVAAVAELSSRTLFKRRTPTITRYGVTLLARTQTFKISKAKTELGYEPIVSMKDGLNWTVNCLNQKELPHSGVFVKVKLFKTGFTIQSRHLAEPGHGKGKIAFHATFASIEHPRFGVTLFDTGYAPRIVPIACKWPYSIYNLFARVDPASIKPACVLIREAGISPSEIKRIIISHFHPDHVAGLCDFEAADFITSAKAWGAVKTLSGIRALRRAYIPNLLPDDFEQRLSLIEYFHDPGFSTFHKSHDLFGDHSVRLVDLSGHAEGMLGALVRVGHGRFVFLISDAVYTRRSLKSGALPHWLTRVFSSSRSDSRRTLHRLQKMQETEPGIDFIPCHSPEVSAEIEDGRWR